VGGVAIFGFVVPQTELAFDRWVLTSAAIFSSARGKVSAMESLGGPDVSIKDLVGGMGVGKVRVNA
jgi:hypothetical protein